MFKRMHFEVLFVEWWPLSHRLSQHGLLLTSTENDSPDYLSMLTNWGRVTHICVSKLIIIGSDNGLSPDRRQAIVWTNAGILLKHWGRDEMDAISQTTFSNAFSWMKIFEHRLEFHMKFVPKDPINNILALVQIMAWGRPGDKPLSESMMVSLPTHICVTRPQWVNWILGNKLQWNFNRNSNIFVQEIAFENGVCEMASIFLGLSVLIPVGNRTRTPGCYFWI